MQILTEENTSAQVELENHVVSEEHKKAGAKLAALTSFPHGGAAEKGKGRGRGRGRGKLDPTRGKVYKGRPNALSSDTMKAQRGRRGLISFGEVTYIFVSNAHGIRICIKRKKIDYGKFFDFCAEKCVYN